MTSSHDLENFPVPADVLFGALSGADWFEDRLGENARDIAREIMRHLEVSPVFACAAYRGRLDRHYYADNEGGIRVLSLRPADVVSVVAKVFGQQAPACREFACRAVLDAADEYLTPERRAAAAAMVLIGPVAAPAP